MSKATSLLMLAVLLVICSVCPILARHGSIEAQFHVSVGGRVDLFCRTTLSSSVDWRYHWSPFDSPSFIYSNNRMYDNIPERITVAPNTNGDYNLTINGAVVNDTGLYTCIEDGGFGSRHTFSVLVDEAGPPECGSTAPHTGASPNGALAASTVIIVVLVVVVVVMLVVIVVVIAVNVFVKRRKRRSNTNDVCMSDQNFNITQLQVPLMSKSPQAKEDTDECIHGTPEPQALFPKFEFRGSTESLEKIRGVCVLGDRLYVIRDGQSSVEVYDRHSLKRSGRLPVSDDVHPGCMALVSTARCLYIAYYDAKIIRRFSLDSSAVTQWNTDGEPDGIAHVPNSANVIVALRLADKLVVYKPDGIIVNKIELPRGTQPQYALPFQGDRFLVCGGYRSCHLLHLCDKDGHTDRTIGTKTSDPLGIVVDQRGGNVLVANYGSGNVAMFNSKLEYVCNAVPASESVKNPCKLCFDDECETLYIGEFSDNGRVLAYSVTRA